MDAYTEKLQKIIKERKALAEEVDEANDERLDEIEARMKELDEEESKLRKEAIKERSTRRELTNPEKENRKKHEEIDKEGDRVNPYSTKEYRKNFRDYMEGRIDKKQLRADETTDTDDVGAIVPTTIMERVVEELKDYGDILDDVTFTNFPAGVEIPVANVKPSASWVSEGSVADKQKKSIDAAIQFSYYKLQVRIARTLLSSVVSLDVWESTVASNIAEAMSVALEEAVISGSGSGQPTGVINLLDDGDEDAGYIPEDNQIEFESSDATYTGWINKLLSNIPIAYRKQRNGKIYMNPLTWDKYVAGLTDDNGQPVARVDRGLDGETVHRFLGKEVVLTDLLPSIDDADAEDVTVIYGNFANYMINTNLQLRTVQYFDEDTDEYIRKATLIADGKLADPFGFVVLHKPAA